MKKLVLTTVVTAFMAGAMAVQAADAKGLYDKECAKCHGADGKGDTKMGKKLNAKDYTSAKVQAEMTDDKAFKAIKDGLKEGDKTLMKPIEGASDADIKALVAFMRTFKK